MFSQRGVMNLAHNLQDVRDLKRRTHANRLNGIDAVWLETEEVKKFCPIINTCLLYTSPSPRDRTRSRMPSSA